MINMTKSLAAIALALTLAFGAAGAALAHEGHDHKVMGTVAAIKDSRLEVKGADGKIVAFTLTDQTKILRGKTPATRADIKADQRVVVVGAMPPATKDATAAPKDAHPTMIAKEVHLGVAGGAAGTAAGTPR